MLNWLKKHTVALKIKTNSDIDEIQDAVPFVQTEISESETLKNRGNAYFDEGNLEDAAECYRLAILRDPQHAEAHYKLGNVLNRLGQFNEAEKCFRRALEIKPDYTYACVNLGNVLKELGRVNDAVASYRRALEIKPDFAEVHYNLGILLAESKRLVEAENSFRRALELKPDFASGYYNLGSLLVEANRMPEAEFFFRRTLEQQPDHVEALNNLGNMLTQSKRFPEAEASFLRALKLKPDYAEAHNNLGNALQTLGRLDEAVASFRRALEIKPDYFGAHSNLIFSMDLSATVNMAELHKIRKEWDAAYAAHLWHHPQHANDLTPARRLRVGYVSADFRTHSAARVFGGMLVQYDRSLFDVFAYSNHKGQDDEITELFRKNVTAWRNIADLSDEEAAKKIREDQIDILVDLSGHSAGNRLLVFARKPAPIQITAWGYATGTGMRAMDVFLTDPVMVPPHDKQYFTEEVRYLPSVVGSFFTEQLPDVNQLPALSEGIVTFGSFNRLVKISKETYQAWAEILLAMPGSRLILKAPELNNASTQDRVVGYFTHAGVEADRIITLKGTPWFEHMQTYNQIDIALDPFPHGGGVTTLEGMMMGVPVINLRWPTVTGRLSASIMTTLGLPDWIAETREEYVKLAIQKARDLQSLAALRKQLRSVFTTSVIGDQLAYARAVEKEYRQLWQEWCASQLSQDPYINENIR